MLDERSKIYLGMQLKGWMEVTVFNAVSRKGLTEKEQFRKDLREVKELAFNIRS